MPLGTIHSHSPFTHTHNKHTSTIGGTVNLSVCQGTTPQQQSSTTTNSNKEDTLLRRKKHQQQRQHIERQRLASVGRHTPSIPFASLPLDFNSFTEHSTTFPSPRPLRTTTPIHTQAAFFLLNYLTPLYLFMLALGCAHSLTHSAFFFFLNLRRRHNPFLACEPTTQRIPLNQLIFT